MTVQLKTHPLIGCRRLQTNFRAASPPERAASTTPVMYNTPMRSQPNYSSPAGPERPPDAGVRSSTPPRRHNCVRVAGDQPAPGPASEHHVLDSVDAGRDYEPPALRCPGVAAVPGALGGSPGTCAFRHDEDVRSPRRPLVTVDPRRGRPREPTLVSTPRR